MLKNFSIRAKITIIPAATGLILLVLGCYAFILLSGNEARVRQLNDGVLRHSRAAQIFAEETERSLSRLYRLTSVVANEADDQKIAALGKTAFAETEAYASRFAPLKTSLKDSSIAADRIAAFETVFTAYLKALKATIDMAETDAGTSLIFLRKAQQQFDALMSRLNEFREDLSKARSEQIEGIYSAMAGSRLIFGAAIVIALLVIAALSWAIGGRIAAPVIAMAGALGEIAAKRYDAIIPALGQRDELGRMAAAVDMLKRLSVAADRLAQERESAHAAEAAHRNALEVAVAEFDTAAGRIVTGVAAAATQMTQSAHAMSDVADGVARQAQSVATAAAQTSASVQTVATASEQLTTSITRIGQQAANSAEVACRAVEEAARTDSRMNDLAEAAAKIGDVLRIITDIASRTNLLALNATIEAARAGQAGRGFAIVASEVKNLASQTAAATDDIAAQIGTVQQAVRESEASINKIIETIDQINTITTATATAVDQQGAATEEIVCNIQEAAKGTQRVSATIAAMTRASGQAEAAAGQVLGAAGELSEKSDRLRAQIDAFLGQVRAA
jgi:methyl-accepting chemotaxis protein